MAFQQFYVNGRYLGSRKIPDFYKVPGFDVRLHHSYAFFCIRCGDIWGRLVHLGATYTQCPCKPCMKHGDGRLSSTYYYPGECTNFEDDWPPAAIRYEFECELEMEERIAKYGLAVSRI